MTQKSPREASLICLPLTWWRLLKSYVRKKRVLIKKDNKEEEGN